MADHAVAAETAATATATAPAPAPAAVPTAPQQASASALPEGVTDPNYKPPPGRLGNLTVPQQHALEKFKKELQDEGHFVPERMDDAMLLRCFNRLLRDYFAFFGLITDTVAIPIV